MKAQLVIETALGPGSVGSHGHARARMHQNSGFKILTETEVRQTKSLRNAHKIFDGRGLYLLVAPNGGRYWRYNYRLDGKFKTLALGIYPDVPLAKARARHQKARSQLADGIDPCAEKRKLGRRFWTAAGNLASQHANDVRETNSASGVRLAGDRAQLR